MLVFWQLKCNTDWPKSPAPLQPGQVTPAGPEYTTLPILLFRGIKTLSLSSGENGCGFSVIKSSSNQMIFSPLL